MIFNYKKEDLYYLLILFLFSICLVYYFINFYQSYGIFCSDVYVYLLNALYFTGENIRASSTISLSPVICYLTSLLFQLGFKNEIAIFTITGIFAIFGNIGLFLLLKTRFNNLLSFLGTIIFISFSVNLAWLANGSIDLAAVSVTFWTMLCTILAVNKNPKYFILVSITFIISFFIRPTVILFLPVIILYYLLKRNFLNNLFNKNKFLKLKNYFTSKEFRYIILGLLIGLTIFIFILNTIFKMGDEISFFDQSTNAISGARGATLDNAYNTNPFFYLENFPNFLSSTSTVFIDRKLFLLNPSILSYGFIGILIVGILLFLSKIYTKISKNDLSKIILLILLVFFILLTFNHISSVISIILSFLALLLFGFIFKKYKFNYFDLNIAFLSWILFNLIFFSYLDIKVDRYIIPSMVGITYFLINFIYMIQSKFPKKENLFKASYLILIIILILSSFAFIDTFEKTSEFKSPEDMSIFLTQYDTDYKNKSIGVYNVRYYSWYLETYTEAISSNDSNIIDNSNITYYISDKPLNLNNFKEIKNIDNLYLYERLI